MPSTWPWVCFDQRLEAPTTSRWPTNPHASEVLQQGLWLEIRSYRDIASCFNLCGHGLPHPFDLSHDPLARPEYRSLPFELFCTCADLHPLPLMNFPPKRPPREPSFLPLFPEVPPPPTPPFSSSHQNLGCGVAVLLTLLLLGKWLLFGGCEAPLPHVSSLKEPLQAPLPQTLPLAAPPGFSFTAHHSYEVTALILARARYRFDKESFFSPVDLALGWGIAALHPYVNKIQWSQSGRWYYFKYNPDDLPFPGTMITQNSANTHIIPPYGNKPLQRTLLSFRRGDVVFLRGYLVTITAKNGQFHWRSSVSRTDKGGGSCEIMYVTEARKVDLK